METTLQDWETQSTGEMAQDGLGPIKLIRDITHKRDKTAQAMLDLVWTDKHLANAKYPEGAHAYSCLAVVEVIKGARGAQGTAHEP